MHGLLRIHRKAIAVIAFALAEATFANHYILPCYDDCAGVWVPATAMHVSRSKHTATLLPDGQLLVAGGTGENVTASAERYDPDDDVWRIAASLGTARNSHTATLLKNGKVLVAGGESSGRYLSSSEIYDAETDSWRWAASMSFPRT